MIQFENLRFYDKNGYDMNLTPTSDLVLRVDSSIGGDAIIYPYINPDGTITNCMIIDTGYKYGKYTTLSNRAIIDTPDITKITIIEDNKEIFTVPINLCNIEYEHRVINENGEALPVLGIKNITFNNLSTSVVKCNSTFPSITYTGSLFIKETSVDLVETEAIYIFEEQNVAGEQKLMRPVFDGFDVMCSSLGDNDDNIKFFNVNDNDHSITWSKYLLFDDMHIVDPSPLIANIGFRGFDEGVYESIINIYIKKDKSIYNIAQVIVTAEAIGADERLKTLMSNFGIPDVEQYHKLFKETNINEDKVDYRIINEKSKLLLLEYHNIFSYIGSYKSLINVIKFFGYDDIFFKEWFFNCSTLSEESYTVSYNNKDRKETILNFSIDQRKNLKKLNKLSMVYSINHIIEDSYESDNTPSVENSFNYTPAEVKVKLNALRDWLQENIIGVNCRISDITAEGIYFEAFNNLITPTYVSTYEIDESVDINPILLNPDEAIYLNNDREAKISVTFDEIQSSIDFDELNSPFSDFDDSTFENPITNISACQWLTTIETKSCVIGDPNGGTPWGAQTPLLIIDNSIKFFNPGDNISSLICGENKLSISLEECELIKVNNHSDKYKLKIDRVLVEKDQYEVFIVNSESGVLEKTISNRSSYKSYFDLSREFINPDTKTYDSEHIGKGNDILYIFTDHNTILEYKYLSEFHGYMLVISNFDMLFGNRKIHVSEPYAMNIIDGNIVINNDKAKYVISFNYDTRKKDQTINVNITYDTGRLSLIDTNNELIDKYDITVNHAGKYHIECVTWNRYNTCIKSCIKSPVHVYDDPNECYVYGWDENANVEVLDYSPLYERFREYPSIDVMLTSDRTNYLSFKINSIYHSLPDDKSFINLNFYGVKDSNGYYVIDKTEHVITNIINAQNNDTCLVTLSTPPIGYNAGDVVNIMFYLPNGLVNSSTYRILSITPNGIRLNNSIPDVYVDMCDSIKMGRAWKTKASLTYPIKDAREYNNMLHVYLKDDEYIIYYLDRLFNARIYTFDVDYLNKNWLVTYKSETTPRSSITIGSGESVKIKSKEFSYQRNNLWELINVSRNERVFKLENNLKFGLNLYENGVYSINLRSYDIYGNISSVYRNGFIEVK